MLPTSPNSSQILIIPSPAQSLLLLCKKRKQAPPKKNLYIQTKDSFKKMPKQGKIRQKFFKKNTTELVLHWSDTPGQETCPEAQLLCSMRLHWRKVTFPLPLGIRRRLLLG